MPNGQGPPPSQNATEENTYYYTRLGKMMILVVSKRVRQVPPILASRSLVFFKRCKLEDSLGKE